MAASTPGEVRVGPGQQVNDVYVRIKFIHSTRNSKLPLHLTYQTHINTHTHGHTRTQEREDNTPSYTLPEKKSSK